MNPMPGNSHIHVRPADEAERIRLESLVRDDYERCHPGDAFDDMKRRVSFSREDQGLYRDWLAVAAVKAAALSSEAIPPNFPMAAE
jgi:hypothetical protein